MSFQIISPHNQQIYANVTFQSQQHAQNAITMSIQAQKQWKLVPLSKRVEIVGKFVECLLAKKDEICTELSSLIGRPRKQNYNEMNGFEFRARHLLSIAESSLADVVVQDTPEFKRFMTREPLGYTEF